MTLRPPSEKLESNAIKKFKTGKLLPNWPHLAANPLACSGRKWSGLIWPQLPWLVLAATQMALCGREFTVEIESGRTHPRPLCLDSFYRPICLDYFFVHG